MGYSYSLFTEKLICSVRKVSLINPCDETVLVNHKAKNMTVEAGLKLGLNSHKKSLAEEWWLESQMLPIPLGKSAFW